ncbi:mucin-6-like [Rhincodon typus]|uniref:mucin-6-like n=1 Tax=Rhincodon typus TaxID=259920 RepID=UPI0020302408|nr:mucin-6-like [Rhincodon typus]
MADCPGNQIYQECGSPCKSTCLNPQFTCDSYCKPGCFCPPGTVLDYITSKDKCIPRHECPCVLNGNTYAPGEKMDSSCTSCTCVGAQWDCSDIQCPGTCSIEGGSFMTTFDERTYRFHGDCEYLLVGSNKMPRHGTIEAIFEQCGTTYTKTRLASVIYATYEMKIVFSMNGKIEVNNQRKNLPFRTGNIKIYRRSSNYIQMNTNFGLDILFKVTEVFQVYITVGVMFYGSTSGISCPHNQTFSYDSRACNRTCLSLSDPNFECSASDAPVDGCNCPEHTYLDDTGKCVSAAECPCFLAHTVIAHANEKINLYGGICVCENGNLKCTGQDPQVCGLCGNANGNIKDELITQSQHSAFTLMSFVNSWKEDPMCDDVTEVVYPCAKNPYRKSWAEKRCKIIHSAVFQPCHNLLQWLPYYDKCIRDSCGCELVGDCDCLCDAVAAFAKACLDAGVCIDWRTPDFCPVNCDFYNTHDRRTNGYKYAGDIECKWHYQPCLCPNSPWTFSKTNMEGCYNCSIDEYYDAGQQRCVPCTLLPTPTYPTSVMSTHSSAIEKWVERKLGLPIPQVNIENQS